VQQGVNLEILKNNWLKIPVLLYVVGFIVHNSYLANFGSYEFELVQAKYILSGFGTIAFSMICFAFISIKVNLSYVPDTFHIDKLLPWLLRVTCLPYSIYTFLYLDSITDLLINENILIKFSSLFFMIANFIVMFSVFDVTLMFSEGRSFSARFVRSLFRILSIPMILATFIISWNIPEFSSVVIAATCLFFGIIGIGWRQADRKHGFEPDFLDSNTKELHQDLFSIFIGVTALSIILWIIVLNYVNAIYPKIPVGLGGAKIELVDIYSGSTTINSMLIQETKKWVLYINNDSGNVEKIKSSLVDKIVYMDRVESVPNK
jgi:hypothetical protein